MAIQKLMAEEIKSYVAEIIADKLDSVKSYVDLKVAGLEGRMTAVEGQMQGLRDSFAGLRDSFAGLRDKVEISIELNRRQYEELVKEYAVINRQYEEAIGLLKILLERTDPKVIAGFKGE